MAQPATVADFNLRRRANDASRWRADPDCFFLDPVIPRAANTDDKWAEFAIADGAGAAPTQVRFEYSVSVALRTLVVRAACLQDAATGARYTGMRARQLIADAWRAAASGGSDGASPPPPPPRFLAFHRVVEEASLEAMCEERDAQIAEGVVAAAAFAAGRAIEFDDDSVYWALNKWIACCGRVAQAFSGGAAAHGGRRVVASRAWIKKEKEMGKLHLIVELTSDDDEPLRHVSDGKWWS